MPFEFDTMPLSEEALALIRANLVGLRSGYKVRLVVSEPSRLCSLTRSTRSARGYPRIVAEVVFIGRHVYESRIVRDGYSIEDVLDQIASSMNLAAMVLNTPGMTAVENPASRTDRCGNTVRDRVIFECSARHPRPQLFSVVPKGDRIKPKKPPTKSAAFSEV